MLCEWEREGRDGCAGTVANLAHRQEITHQQGLLERRGGDLVVLEEEGVYEIDRYQCKDDGIDPLHGLAEGVVLRFFPEGPGDELGDVDIEKEQDEKQYPG